MRKPAAKATLLDACQRAPLLGERRPMPRELSEGLPLRTQLSREDEAAFRLHDDAVSIDRLYVERADAEPALT